MIKVTVPALPIKERKGTGKSGKPYEMRLQTVYVHTVDGAGQPLPFPEKTEIVLESGQAPYPAGSYMLSPASVVVSYNGRLELHPKLLPTKAAA
jgi:hypothetical protein